MRNGGKPGNPDARFRSCSIRILRLVLLGGMLQSMAAEELREVEDSHPKLARVQGILFLDQAPFSGYVIERHDNGSLKAKTRWIDGRRDGLSESWYEDGSLREVRLYLRNRKIGNHLGWYENGQMKFDLNLADGVYHGRCRQWYANGQLATDFNFAQGEEAGSQRSWNYEGDLQANYVVRNGHRYGLIGSKSCLSVVER